MGYSKAADIMSVVVGRSSHVYTNVVNNHPQEQDDDESVQATGRYPPDSSQVRTVNNDKDGDRTRDVLALAATNNTPGLAGIVGFCGAGVMDRQGLWKDDNPNRLNGKAVRRTPLMVAAMYGSLETVSYLVRAGVYVNTQSTDDGFTALHCATASGSSKCVQITAVLLKAGADISIRDAAGRRAVDVMSNLLLGEALAALECMLGADILSTATLKQSGAKLANGQPEIEKEEYQSDEFRMFEFKVKRCSRTRAHDWTQCPFAHPGEKARRRDPRRYNYSGIACPDFRKGACPRGDACDLAHGVFECWLHPTRYRTQLCKDGMSCPRRVCFFAHCPSELRQPQLTQQLTQLQMMQSPMGAVVDQGTHQFVALSQQAHSNFSRGNSSSESSSLDDPSPLSADYSVQNAIPLNPIAAAYVSKIKPVMAKESSPDIDTLCQEVVSMDIRSNNRGKADSNHKVPVLPVTTSAAILGSDTKIASSGPDLLEAEYMNGFKSKYLPAEGKGMQKTASFLQMVEDNQCWVANMVNDE